MNARTRHLKIKIRSLAAEAGIIRQEVDKIRRQETKNPNKQKLHGAEIHALNEHRKTVVRRAARYSLLAYACIRGIPYSVCEQKCSTLPDFNLVVAEACRFSSKTVEELRPWALEATSYILTELRKSEKSTI